MQNISKIILTILLISWINISNCNFWDNIFSQTGASSPILLSQSLNFKFPLTYQGIDFDCYVDYNNKFKLLTVKGVKNVILFEVEAFRLQIDLQQFLVSFKNTLAGCKKYKLIITEQDSRKIQKVSLNQKRFLVNVLFKYIGRVQKDRNMNQYVFMPDLMTQHLQQHQQYEKNILLVVNREGNIVKVYTGVDKKQQVPIIPNSVIKDRLNCPGPVEQLTKQDLYEMIKGSIQNKDYENIPGFDKLPIDKIPFNKIPFDKLPKPSN